MHILKLFAMLAPSIHIVQGKCYKGGVKWSSGPQDRNVQNVYDACIGTDGMAGFFHPGETKYQCRGLAVGPGKRGGLKSEFWVQWQGNQDTTLTNEDCVLGLLREVKGCSMGGKATTAGWYFRADPNEGWCEWWPKKGKTTVSDLGQWPRTKMPTATEKWTATTTTTLGA